MTAARAAPPQAQNPAMPELHDPARAPTLSSVPSSVKPAPLTRAERVRRFGVDEQTTRRTQPGLGIVEAAGTRR